MISIVKYAKDKGKGGNSSGGGSTTIINGGGFAGTTNNFTAAMAEVAKNLTSDSPVWKLIDQKDAAILQQAVAKATAAAAANFLSKVDDDTALGVITFAAGLISKAEAYLEGGASFGEFVQGLSGGQIDDQGNAELESLMVRDSIVVPNLTVTKAAHFFKLIIDELKSIGGQIIVTAANATLDKVVPYTSGNEVAEAGDTIAYYRCYFRAKEGDEAGAKAIHNQFAAGDQAVCMTFDTAEGTSYNISSKYYWRYVQNIGTETLTEEDGSTNDYHYIDLSNTNCDANSSVPEVGDAVAQLGNQSDTTRQNAIIISAYQGIDATVAAPSIVQYTGINDYNLSNHKLNVIAANGNVFKGSFFTVNGTKEINIESLISGLEDQINAVNQQVDNKFMMWYGHGTPTLSNEPASEWTTNALKDEHLQDIYFDLDREATSGGGNAYRFVYDSTNGYHWELITDEHTLMALNKIADVASDGKLTGGMEKTRVYIEWQAAIQDYLKYKGQAAAMGIDYLTSNVTPWADYVDALNDLGTYLNAGTDWDIADWDVTGGSPTSDNATPTWIKAANRDTTTVINANYYRLYWNTYYEKLAALLGAMGIETYNYAGQKANIFVTTYNDAVPHPTAPYKAGDLWLHTLANGQQVMKIAQTTRTASQGYVAADWLDITSVVMKEDIRFNLVQLLDELLKLSVFTTAFASVSSLALYLCDTVDKPDHYGFDGDDVYLLVDNGRGGTSESFVTPNLGDMMAYGTAVYQYQRVTIGGVTSNKWVDLQLNSSTLSLTLLAILGKVGSRKLTIYKTLTGSGMSEYDVCCQSVTFQTALTHKTITVDAYRYYYYNGGAWEPISDNETYAFIKNLGNEICAAVFDANGGSQVDINKNAISALTSRVTTVEGNQVTFASELATKVDEDDVEARVHAYAVDSNGNKLSEASFAAWVTTVTEGGRTYLQSGVDVKANQIHLEGYTTINNGFSVDANGNATMNDAVVNGTFTNGTFNETTHRSSFGVFLKNVATITSQRNDYLSGSTTRGGLVSIFGRSGVNDPSNTYRGLYCEGEAEIQGVTQLLRSNANKNNSSVNALIVEGVDNKGNETVAGSLNANGALNVNGPLNLAGCLKTSNFTLPQSPSNGQTYIFKAKNGETVKVFNPYHAIINGSNNSNAVAAGSEFDTGGYTVMLIFSSYHNAWLIMQSN